MLKSLIKMRHVFVALGVILIVASLGMELLPMTRKGIGPLQIAGIIVGILIIVFSFLRGSVWTRVFAVFVSLLITLIALELTLGFFKFHPNHYPGMLDQVLIVDNQICDSQFGCRFNPDDIPETCNSTSDNRSCFLNAQGFFDEDEFIESSALDEYDYRILLLGDSFTWGTSASIGQSWAEIVDRELQENNVIIWNTGIPGTGTKHALVNAQQFMPLMKPDLVVLGFYVGNDFIDNLYPLDYFSIVSGLDDGRTIQQSFVYRYRLDRNLEPVRLSAEETKYHALDAFYPQNSLEYFLGLSRIGTLLVKANNTLIRPNHAQQKERSFTETQNLIMQLNEYVTTNNSQLLVLIIPHYRDTQTPGTDYLEIRNSLRELDINFVDPLPVLAMSDYVLVSDNEHWNNNGHAKSGALMLDCLSFMVNQNDEICSQAE